MDWSWALSLIPPAIGIPAGILLGRLVARWTDG